jgi:alanine racemase
MQQTGTRLEIDLSALADNYRFLKSQVMEGTLFMGVVKANAYGHGIVRIGKEIEKLGADYLAVAYVEEGVRLREAGNRLPILVLHAQTHMLQKCIEKCLEPVIYRLEMLDEFYAFAKAQSTPYPVHIEFNTGMNRLGIDLEDAGKVLQKLKQMPQLKVKGIQSHLAASEDLDERDFTDNQISQFKQVAQDMKSKLGYPVLMHQSNTSGILNFDSAHYDMVRAGIGLYGYGNDPRFAHQLKPVARLVSQISQIRTVQKGESVSYNRSFIADEETTYAVIAVGHGDGIDRRHGHGILEVLVRGKKAPSLGIICMDMFMVDITHIPEAEVGDEVIIFGPENPADLLAENAGTISYELLTGMRKRVRRVYLN